MVSLKDWFVELTTSSGNKSQSLMVAGNKVCKVTVVQIGRLSDFELLICVFLV